MTQEITKLLRKVNAGDPTKITFEELEKISDLYYQEYSTSKTDRGKMINIGYSAYYGWWSVKKGNTNIEKIKSFFERHKIDLKTEHPNDDSQAHLEYLKSLLA